MTSRRRKLNKDLNTINAQNLMNESVLSFFYLTITEGSTLKVFFKIYKSNT